MSSVLYWNTSSLPASTVTNVFLLELVGTATLPLFTKSAAIPLGLLYSRARPLISLACKNGVGQWGNAGYWALGECY